MNYLHYWNLISLSDTGMLLGKLVFVGSALAVLIGSRRKCWFAGNAPGRYAKAPGDSR